MNKLLLIIFLGVTLSFTIISYHKDVQIEDLQLTIQSTEENRQYLLGRVNECDNWVNRFGVDLHENIK